MDPITLAISQIKPFFLDMLVENNIVDPTKKSHDFCCPNPNHDDSSPSSRVLPGNEKGYCHGCDSTFDIFQLNNWLTGAQMSGVGFINHVQSLAKKYGVPFENTALTEAQKDVLESHRAHQMAYDYMKNQQWSAELTEYLDGRNISAETLERLDILCCPNYQRMFEHLKTSFTNQALVQMGFGRASMFSSTSVIFTIKEYDGRIVGFMSRDSLFESKKLSWEEGGRRGSPPRHYDSSSDSNRLFFKSKMLFGFDQILKLRDHSEVYVVEGQFDWASMKQAGLQNTVALSGKHLSLDQTALLKKNQIRTVNFCLDGDPKGVEGIKHILFGNDREPGILNTAKFLRVNIITLPAGQDPNSFFVNNDLDDFYELEKISAFEWVLQLHSLAYDPQAMCEEVMPFIQIEESHIRRETMLRLLSDASGLSFEALSSELHRLDDSSKAIAEREQKSVVEQALNEAKFGASDPLEVLKMAVDKLEEIRETTSTDSVSLDETLEAFDLQLEQEIAGDVTSGPVFKNLVRLQEDLNGDCSKRFLTIGGTPNSGKTALMSQISKELVENNDNSIVLIHTIDDDRAMFNRRLAIQFCIDYAEEIGSPMAQSITLNKLANPNFWIDRYPEANAELLHIREEGYRRLKTYIADGRIQIKDATHGSTTVFLEKFVKQAHKNFSDARKFVIIDNFHKYKDYGNLDERIAVKRRSGFIKDDIATKYDCCVISTIEYKKVESGNRPKNSDIGESGQIEYDANFISHVFNPLKAAMDSDKEASCRLWHGTIGNKMPIIQMDIGKNKINELKGRRHYAFFPSQSRYTSLTEEDVNSIVAMNNMNPDGTIPSHVWKDGRKIELKAPSASLILPKFVTDLPETPCLFDEVPF
jgi:DNA primase catalytic core